MAVAQCVEVFAHGVEQAAGGLQHGVHIGQLALDELELADALAELLAFVHIRHHAVDHRLHDAHRPGGQHRALVIQAAHQHFDAAVQIAQHVLCGHLAILKHQLASVAAAHAQLVELLRHRKALETLLHQEGGDALGTCGRIGLGVDHQHVGVRPVGNPHLAAVEHEPITSPVSTQLHAHHVAARARLAHRQRAHMLAADQLGQVLRLLRGAAVAADLVDAEVGMRAVAQAHRGAGAGDFFQRHHMRQIAHARAAIGLGHGDAQQAQVAELAPQIHRKLIGAVDFGGARGNFLLGKVAHGLAQSSDVFAELEVQSG